MGKDPEVSSSDLLRIFNYREDGEILWSERPSATASVVIGSVAGAVFGKVKKYKTVRVFGKKTFVHRVVWAMHNGAWPTDDVDHIDGDGLNNRIENLRLATRSQNCMNRKVRSDNASGLKGARKRKNRDGSDAWISCITLGGITKHLGRFRSAEDAHLAYMTAANENFKEFARAS